MKFLRIYNLGCKSRTIVFWLRVLKCRTVTHWNVLRNYQFRFQYILITHQLQVHGSVKKGGTKLVKQANYCVRTFVKSLRKIFLAMLINSWNLKVMYLDQQWELFPTFQVVYCHKQGETRNIYCNFIYENFQVVILIIFLNFKLSSS